MRIKTFTKPEQEELYYLISSHQTQKVVVMTSGAVDLNFFIIPSQPVMSTPLFLAAA